MCRYIYGHIYIGIHVYICIYPYIHIYTYTCMYIRQNSGPQIHCFALTQDVNFRSWGTECWWFQMLPWMIGAPVDETTNQWLFLSHLGADLPRLLLVKLKPFVKDVQLVVLIDHIDLPILIQPLWTIIDLPISGVPVGETVKPAIFKPQRSHFLCGLAMLVPIISNSSPTLRWWSFLQLPGELNHHFRDIHKVNYENPRAPHFQHVTPQGQCPRLAAVLLSSEALWGDASEKWRGGQHLKTSECHNFRSLTIWLWLT